MHKNLIVLLVILLIAASVVGGLWHYRSAETPVLHGDEASQVARSLSALWRGEDDTAVWQPRAEAVYLAARRRGRRLAQIWIDEPDLSAAVQRLREALEHPRDVETVDTLELVLAHDFRVLDPQDHSWSTNIHRGVHGFELSHGEKRERYAPTYMLSTNWDTRQLMRIFKLRNALSGQQMLEEVGYRLFEADQWLISLDGNPGAMRMERGNTYVPVKQVSAASTLELGRLAADWMRRNLHDNGRMTYKFWPSAREESTANNMIRQWMATIALIRAAKYWDDAELMQRAAANIDYNLERFYREENGLGLIEWRGKIKLGAVALAALALLEHADSQRWAAQEAALRRTTDHLWHEDGSFTTFYKPKGRNDIQNFYPGEALLYWAALYEQGRDSERLKRIMQSFQHYRGWHLDPANRNPAFIPWHTQAYYKIWRLTGEPVLRDFVFTMNDWLVDEMQQWEGEVVYRDTLGRFYNPARPFGPPHVSSTGVYLEGLIDAFGMARQEGDKARQEKYRLAIVRGLRSVMQLQFDSELDMYYVPEALRPRVYGGMRTTVYDNEIRCDNVQHNLMAMLKILEGFGIDDYRHP